MRVGRLCNRSRYEHGKDEDVQQTDEMDAHNKDGQSGSERAVVHDVVAMKDEGESQGRS